MALTVLQLKALQPKEKVYRRSAGASLYVLVYPNGKKSYEFAYKVAGKLKRIIVGNVAEMGLATAREQCSKLKAMRADGLDPLAQRRIATEGEHAQLHAAKEAAAARRAELRMQREAAKRERLTLAKVANEWVESMRSHWSEKHADQNIQSLEDHVYPTVGRKSIHAVTTADVLDVIDKLLAEGKVETARRVRQRLEAVFEYACMKHRVTGNPVASAKRETNKRVKAAGKVHVEHNFPCIEPHELPHLLRAMRAYVGTPVTKSLAWLSVGTGRNENLSNCCRFREAPEWGIFGAVDCGRRSSSDRTSIAARCRRSFPKSGRFDTNPRYNARCFASGLAGRGDCIYAALFTK